MVATMTRMFGLPRAGYRTRKGVILCVVGGQMSRGIFTRMVLLTSLSLGPAVAQEPAAIAIHRSFVASRIDSIFGNSMTRAALGCLECGTPRLDPRICEALWQQ
jgi:hypothetical protein